MEAHRPGILLASAIMIWGAFEMIRKGVPPIASMQVAAPHLSAATLQPLEQAGWVAVGLGASLLSWLLSRRLAGRSSLL
jgi:hypothetical protein